MAGENCHRSSMVYGITSVAVLRSWIKDKRYDCMYSIEFVYGIECTLTRTRFIERLASISVSRRALWFREQTLVLYSWKMPALETDWSFFSQFSDFRYVRSRIKFAPCLLYYSKRCCRASQLNISWQDLISNLAVHARFALARPSNSACSIYICPSAIRDCTASPIKWRESPFIFGRWGKYNRTDPAITPMDLRDPEIF